MNDMTEKMTDTAREIKAARDEAAINALFALDNDALTDDEFDAILLEAGYDGDPQEVLERMLGL